MLICTFILNALHAKWVIISKMHDTRRKITGCYTRVFNSIMNISINGTKFIKTLPLSSGEVVESHGIEYLYAILREGSYLLQGNENDVEIYFYAVIHPFMMMLSGIIIIKHLWIYQTTPIWVHWKLSNIRGESTNWLIRVVEAILATIL